MKNIKLIPLQIIYLILLAINCSGQVLSLGTGQMFYNSKTIVPVINQVESGSNDEYHSLDLTLNDPDRYMLGVEFSTYQGWVDFSALSDSFGFGSSRTRLLRLSPYLGYVVNPNKKFRFIPYFKAIFEQSFITGSSGVTNTLDNYYGYSGAISVEPIKRIQVAPGAGLILSWNPFGKIYIKGNIYYTYGYSPFQKYYFEYSFKGLDQPTAEWHANGTGVFTTISIGYKLWDKE